MKPGFSKEVADEYFVKTYSDSDRSFKYSPPRNLPRPPPPKIAFDASTPSFDDFSGICWKKSSGSAPGMNGIPYLVTRCVLGCGEFSGKSAVVFGENVRFRLPGRLHEYV